MPTPVATTERTAVLGVPAADAGPAESPPGCAACPHPVADHDAVGLRYCRATVDSALERGCVCPSG